MKHFDIETKKELKQLNNIRVESFDLAERDSIQILNQLSEKTLQHRSKSDEMFTNLKKRIEEDFNTESKMIEKEKNDRTGNEGSLYNFVKDMHKRILTEINEEKREREKAEQVLVG